MGLYYLTPILRQEMSHATISTVVSLIFPFTEKLKLLKNLLVFITQDNWNLYEVSLLKREIHYIMDLIKHDRDASTAVKAQTTNNFPRMSIISKIFLHTISNWCFFKCIQCHLNSISFEKPHKTLRTELKTFFSSFTPCKWLIKIWELKCIFITNADICQESTDAFEWTKCQFRFSG